MRRSCPWQLTPVLSLALMIAAAGTSSPSPVPDSVSAALGTPAGIRTAIESHLGRPYVWGASGLKSFDCSGFVWRVMQDNGILVKRTTARKYYFSLPKVAEEARWEFGNLVFFDNLKHCGIVDTRETFYHSAVSTGTHRSRFDPLWRGKITGVRAMPRSGHREATAQP